MDSTLNYCNLKNLILLLSLVIIGCSCNHTQNTQSPSLYVGIEGNWIASDSICFNVANGFVYSSIYHTNLRRCLAFKYSFLHDTMVLKYLWPSGDNPKSIMFRIVKFTPTELGLKLIGSACFDYHYVLRRGVNLEGDTTYFFKRYADRKNSKRIKNLKFVTRRGNGCMPSLNLMFNKDSVLFYRGDEAVLHKGLGKHKLSNAEFSKVNEMFNHLNTNTFNLPSWVSYNRSVPYYYVQVETSDNENFECEGMLDISTPIDLRHFIVFLYNLEQTLDIKMIDRKKDSAAYLKAKQLLDFKVGNSE